MAAYNGEKRLTRTRFAPSPTGLLHIGGARTALFNYLWAKHLGGEFLLRFEDTDRTRSATSFSEAIMRDLVWLGLVPDGEIINQSDRSSRHMQVLKELIKRGAAYPCFCPAAVNSGPGAGACSGICRGLSSGQREERLSAGEPYCWRLAVPASEKTYAFQDRLHGLLSVPSENILDFVLTRTDGSCTYLFAVVVDDHDADITHVIRGEEHISNTPKQEMIYRALGWAIPEWAHIPMVLDEDRHKLSKRSGAISISSYRETGWDPAAIVAYLATLSWSGAPAERISSLAELSEHFSLEAVASSSLMHDHERLRHFGKLALASADKGELLRDAMECFPKIEQRETLHTDRLEIISELLPFCATKNELAAALEDQFNFCAPPLGEAPKLPWLPLFARKLTEIPASEWSEANIKQCLRAFQKANALKGKDFYHGLRYLLTGRNEGVPLALLMACLGKGNIFDRITAAA